MSGAVELADDTLRAIAAGVYPPTYAEERALAAEVLRLRERAEKVEAERDALRAAVRECHALERVAADPPPRQALAAAIAADEAWERVVALVGEG